MEGLTAAEKRLVVEGHLDGGFEGAVGHGVGAGGSVRRNPDDDVEDPAGVVGVAHSLRLASGSEVGSTAGKVCRVNS